ncbi:MAG TPA: KUP/HAK/KT family potassium transporter, partial [Pseudomonadota bacterium]|nr:KUP/HAK/KT family potassium transporter [Pseudomonadota bacterium]
MALGAVGVVYGDIGTSPLYALKECFTGEHGMAINNANVFGILSLVFWALTMVVVFKYISFILRADNNGEGGTLSLLSQIVPRGGLGKKAQGRMILILVGLFGASLLYGDGVITPVISVFSAVEGLQARSPALEPYVLPISVVIIVGMFLVQKRGTAKVGALFGPVMVVWFVGIALVGLPWIIRNPYILGAINPLHAVRFFIAHRVHGFLALGAVVLCVTGGEALYADMGHFGVRAIRLAWFAVVFPALLLNYFGQGALLLADP